MQSTASARTSRDGNPNPKKLLACLEISSDLKMRFFSTPPTNEVGVVANGTKVARR
jgi:hypothetical protein